MRETAIPSQASFSRKVCRAPGRLLQQCNGFFVMTDLKKELKGEQRAGFNRVRCDQLCWQDYLPLPCE